MKKVWIHVLIAVALAASAAFVACGEEEEEGAAEPTATTEAAAPTEEETEEAVVEEEEEEEEAEEAGEAVSIGDVPVYPGAEMIQSGQWSGAEAAIPMMGEGMDPEAYGTIEYAMYETGDSAEDVFSFYEDEMGDWQEVWTFSGGDEEGVGGMGIWTKDDENAAAWVVVSEEDDVTSLMIAVGSQ